LSEEASDLLLHGVAETGDARLRRPSELHLLIKRLVEEVDPEREEIETDWEHDKDHLGKLSDAEKTVVLDVLTLATVLAGRPRRAQRGSSRRFTSRPGASSTAGAEEARQGIHGGQGRGCRGTGAGEGL
jgi:DNA helicase HerA-like ATPase